MMSPRISFITNVSCNVSAPLFERLAKEYNVEFLFTGGQEKYWDKKNRGRMGKFNGCYLKGFYILPKIKITPDLLKLDVKNIDVFIKTIDDRFALPFIFLLAKIRKKPFILYTQHWMHPKTVFHYFSFAFMKYIYKHSDAIVVYGKHVRRYLNGLGVPDDRIFEAPQSIDNTLFDKSVSGEEKDILKDKLGVRAKKIVLFVGRREYCKGLDYLIEASGMIQYKDFCVLFIGSESEDTDYKKLCVDHGVPHLFLNHIPNTELYKYYAIADIFVLPSITTKNFKEPWGAVINEAMNQGCPVVTTDAVGAAAGGLIDNEENGFIVPERDSRALEAAIEKLLTNDGLREKMALNSSAKIKKWTLTQTLKGFDDAINHVMLN